VGGHGILYPPRLKKWGGHVPRVPHQIAPMLLQSTAPIPKLVAFRQNANALWHARHQSNR